MTMHRNSRPTRRSTSRRRIVNHAALHREIAAAFPETDFTRTQPVQFVTVPEENALRLEWTADMDVFVQLPADGNTLHRNQRAPVTHMAAYILGRLDGAALSGEFDPDLAYLHLSQTVPGWKVVITPELYGRPYVAFMLMRPEDDENALTVNIPLQSAVFAYPLIGTMFSLAIA